MPKMKVQTKENYKLMLIIFFTNLRKNRRSNFYLQVAQYEQFCLIAHERRSPKFKRSISCFNLRPIAIEKIYKIFKKKINKAKFKGPLAFSPSFEKRESLLATNQQNTNYRGFLNLMIVVLVCSNLRLIIENLQKYGWLVRFINPIDFIKDYKNYPCYTSMLFLNVFAFFAYFIQYFSFMLYGTIKKIDILNFINIALIPIFSLFITIRVKAYPSSSIVLHTVSLILMAKLISYQHVMRNMKKFLQQIENKNQQFSNDQKIIEEIGENQLSFENFQILKKVVSSKNHFFLLNWTHFVYFLLAPTLCFQFHYPKTNCIRKIWLLKRIIEFLCIISLIQILWHQYINPLLLNTIPILQDKTQINITKLVERILKLAIPNLILFISFFYAVFHSYLNILAELLRFADRQFYLDWWNCHTLGEYWRLWNLPVHHFFMRHVYNPLLKSGFDRRFAIFVVFLISSLFHEYLMKYQKISVAIRQFQLYAFIGFMLQAPILISEQLLRDKLKNSQIGNVFFWVLFAFIGQPALLLIYHYMYIVKIQINQ